MDTSQHKSTTETILDVRNLKAYFNTPEGVARAVDDVSFSIRKGEVFSLVGESGCGKSVTTLAIMRLLPQPTGYIAGGEIRLDGQDLLALPAHAMRTIRGARISMIFQEPMTSLNPVFTIGDQVAEVFRLHQGVTAGDARERTIALLELVKLPSAAQRFNEYPHQLSGGMKQRVMIAMALAGDPELLIADEPTTALDVTTQAQVLNLLIEIRERLGTAILLVTHDMGIVNEYADRVGVMYAGQLAEIAATADLLRIPQHPYTAKLLEALPTRDDRGRDLNAIRGAVPPATQYGSGCRFFDRCPIGTVADCGERTPELSAAKPDHWVACFKAGTYQRETTTLDSPVPSAAPTSCPAYILEAGQVKVHFPIRKGVMKRVVGLVKAVDGFDLRIERGKTTALVGESGCGKTTFGKTLVNLVPVTSGELVYDGISVNGLSSRAAKALRKKIQMIFQDPYSSLDPRMRVGDIVREGPRSQRLPWSTKREQELLELVAVPHDAVNRYPHEFSGGQRQRISIARALAVEPEFIICDEATSALDVSVQAQVLNLLRDIQQRLGLTYLIITHDIAVVEYIADTIAVMYLGRIVEEGPAEAILDNAGHPYTRALLEAVPRVKEAGGGKKIVLAGDVPSPVNPPAGCHFYSRCPLAMARCRKEYPPKYDLGNGHLVRCFLVEANRE